MSVNMASRSRKTLGDAVGTGVYHITSTFANLASTPVLLWGLGLEGYGFLALLSAAGKYGGVTDFGIGPSITRHVAEFDAHGDTGRVRQTITFGTLFYIALLIIAVPTAFLAAPRLVGLGHFHNAAIREQAPALLTAFIANYFVQLLAGCFSAALAGLGHVRLTAQINAASRIIFAIVGIVSMFLHMGLTGITYAFCVQGVLVLIITYTIARRIYGPLFVDPRRLEKATVRRIVSNGGWIQLSSLMVLIYAETDQLVIAAVLGLSASALFDVGSRLARAVRALAYYFNSAFLPAVASYEARFGAERLLEVFADGTRYLGVVTFFASGMLYVAAAPFVTLWVGPGPHDQTIVWIVQILVFVYLIDNMLAVAITMLRGMGLPKIETSYSVVNAVVNILLTIVLVRPFGMAGILIGTLGGTVIGAAVFLTVFSRTRSFNVRAAIARPMLRLAATLAATLAAVSIVQQLFFVSLRANRVGAMVELAVTVVLYTLVFALALRFVKALSPGDRVFLERAMPSAFKRVFDSRLVRSVFASNA